MKNKFLFLYTSILLLACSPKEELNFISGEFLFYQGAAVLNTGTEIYGVVVDDTMKELHEQCIAIQKDEYDMVKVYVKGTIAENPSNEGWEQILSIKEIDSIAPSDPVTSPPIQINID